MDEPYQSFPTTQWSLVRRAGGSASEQTRQALQDFLRRYLPALQTFLVLTLRVPRDEVDDLLQGFVADKLMQKRILAQADQNRGRFRTFLLTVLSHYVSTVKTRARSQRRAPAQPRADVGRLPGLSAGEDPARAFEVAWARQVVADAVDDMKNACAAGGRADLWAVFDGRILGPLLHQSPPTPYGDLVEQFNLRSPTEAFNTLITAKRMFARHLRSVVGVYAGDPRDIDTEIAELRAILARGGAG